MSLQEGDRAIIAEVLNQVLNQREAEKARLEKMRALQVAIQSQQGDERGNRMLINALVYSTGMGVVSLVAGRALYGESSEITNLFLAGIFGGYIIGGFAGDRIHHSVASFARSTYRRFHPSRG